MLVPPPVQLLLSLLLPLLVFPQDAENNPPASGASLNPGRITESLWQLSTEFNRTFDPDMMNMVLMTATARKGEPSDLTFLRPD